MPESAVTIPLDTMEAVMRAVNRLHIGNIPAKDRHHIETANREVEQVRTMVGGTNAPN